MPERLHLPTGPFQRCNGIGMEGGYFSAAGVGGHLRQLEMPTPAVGPALCQLTAPAIVRADEHQRQTVAGSYLSGHVVDERLQDLPSFSG